NTDPDTGRPLDATLASVAPDTTHTTTPPAVTTAEPRPTVKPAPRTYQVRAKDSLSRIAREQLGSERRADELFRLNRGVLKSPNKLVPGTVLKLPADTAHSSQAPGENHAPADARTVAAAVD